MLQIPTPIFRKTLFTELIGIGCFLFGTVYYYSARDRILLILSAVVFLCSTIRALLLYHIARKKAYEIVIGTCVSVSQKIFGKLKTVKMMDDDGKETTLQIPKGSKIKIGERYRFYFQKRDDSINTEIKFLDTKLAAESLLGYEQLKE